MEPMGGTPRRRRAALVASLLAAVALLAGACGGSGAAVSSRDGGTDVAERTTEPADREGRRSVVEDDTEERLVASTTTSTTTTSTTTTTAAPPTTAAAPPTTAAPPPPPPTTAPPPPPATAPPPPPSGPVHGSRNTGCEQYMYDQINAARANAGRGALAFDTGIQYIALDWSDEMAGTQTLKHNPSYGDQIVRHRDYRTAGENVGRGGDLAGLFQAFMNSPGHRANIESTAYSHVTVGCLTDGGGQLWVTQNFWGS